MSEHIMEKAKRAALQAFRSKAGAFTFMGCKLSIRHAHHNEYQVLLPDGDEIIRIIDNIHPTLLVY